MAAARRQINGARFLPAANLHSMVRSKLGVTRERVADVVAGTEPVVDRPEVEPAEIDGVESERIDMLDRVAQRQVRPWTFPKLVRIVVNEPAGVELPCELGLPEKNPFPVKGCRTAVRARLRETLYPHHPAAEMTLDACHGAIRGAIVNEIDVHALMDKVRDDLFDDVRFVVQRK